MARGPHRSAFTLIELLAATAIVAILIAIVLPALGKARRTGRLAVCTNNMRQFGIATGSYAADYEDRIFAFSWQGAETYLMADEMGELKPQPMPDHDVLAAVRQAVHILRVRADRVGYNGTSLIPLVPNWIPHCRFSHLVILDYMSSRPLDPSTICPEEGYRANWRTEPLTRHDHGYWLPLQFEPTPPNRVAVYGSSYEVAPASYDRLQSNLSIDPAVTENRIRQGGAQYNFLTPNDCSLGGLRLDSVAFASRKVHVHESNQHHFGPRRPYFGLEQARLPLLYFDGSVSVRRTAEANPGWKPNVPTYPCHAFLYTPRAWEPPTISGNLTDFVKGYYRWTRGGLKGIDFGGKPLDTGQPEPGVCDL